MADFENQFDLNLLKLKWYFKKDPITLEILRFVDVVAVDGSFEGMDWSSSPAKKQISYSVADTIEAYKTKNSLINGLDLCDEMQQILFLELYHTFPGLFFTDQDKINLKSEIKKEMDWLRAQL